MGLVVALLAAVGVTGCTTASATGGQSAGASQGAPLGIATTGRGAAGEVTGEVADVETRAQKVLRDNGIVIADSEIAPVGVKRVLEGAKGDTTVVVTLTETSENYTHVDVVAQKSGQQQKQQVPEDQQPQQQQQTQQPQWDTELARKLVQDIARG